MSEENKKTVLVVDDNAANSFVLASMMERLGFIAEEAASGREAIDYVCQKEYDLILMDHLMPGMDGIETIEQILFVSEGKKQPIIIGISATVDAEVTHLFRKVGAKDVLEKPVRMEKLEKMLNQTGMNSMEMGYDNIDVEEEEQDEIDIDSILSHVSGLNYKKGIDIMAGSVENYMKVLSVSVKNISDNFHAVELVYENKHLDNNALYFHSLKGIFLNIGADDLAEKSRELELASKDNRHEFVSQKAEEYLQLVKKFVGALNNACEAYKEKKYNAYAGVEISSSDFAGKLSELRAHIEDFEYIEITELLEQMLASVSGEQKEALQKIEVAIQDFEYDKAIEIVDELKASC